MIEHAIYASTRSGQQDGYQVVAASPGVCAEDVRELALWCPSHNGLLDPAAASASINAHPLPSGAHCVSRSFAAGSEYSGRGGAHVVTHALVVSPKDYARFANNPFAVMKAAVAAGQSTSSMASERSLQPFELAGRARPFDGAAVRQAATKYSAMEIARALDVCLAADTTAIATTDDAGALMAALLTCLPVGLRARTSLATGLVHSSTRPYQWIAQKPDVIALRQLENSFGVSVAQVAAHQAAEGQVYTADAEHWQNAWVGFVAECLRANRHAELDRQIQRFASVENVAELDALAANELPSHGVHAGSNAFPGEALSSQPLTPVESLH